MPANFGEAGPAASGQRSGSTHESAIGFTEDQSAGDRERAQRLSRQLGPPAQVEGYQIERCLGAGAFGTVWLATQTSTGKKVAIKFYEHRGGLDWTLLNREVEKLAVLYTERDVVRLIDVGWDASPPYYVMEYLERGSLEQAIADHPMPVSEAVRIVREVAQALVHAHGRGILHCDIKPANVLLDNDWKVRLADFGQSRLSYEQRPALGTLFYMAPEQADLAATPDARWDVYALGALLYHLLTGNPPYRSTELESRLHSAANLTGRLEQYRQAIMAAARPVGHRRVRGVDRALAEIVDRCLERDPARRYPNAQAVLDALDRRARMRARRPLIALGLVAPILLLVGTVAQGVVSWRDAVQQSEDSLVNAVQAGNVYAANGVANTVLLELHKLSHEVEHASESESLRRWLIEDDRPATQTFLEQLHTERNGSRQRIRNGHENAFESWLVMDVQGTVLARSPHSAVIGRDYGWRDYFQGAISLKDKPGESVYISRVFQSESDNLYKFAISSPIRRSADSDEVVGAIVATVTTGILPLKDDRRTAVLVGRWDTNRRPGEPADANPEFLILLHPARKKDDPPAAPTSPVIRHIEESREAGRPLNTELAIDNAYTDPFRPGRWLAGFAPVGNTEFIVIVQQRYDEAIAPVNILASRLAWRGWTALCFGGVLLAAMWYYVQQAMNRRDRIANGLPRK